MHTCLRCPGILNEPPGEIPAGKDRRRVKDGRGNDIPLMPHFVRISLLFVVLK
jgi:hypothetical protein